MRSSRVFMTRTRHAELALVVVAMTACHRTSTQPAAVHDAAVHLRDASSFTDAFDNGPTAFGPPNPWGDGSLPSTTAIGPEAAQTLSAMTALRASIGFWRVERSQRDHCPTLEDLAHTPGAAFDPTTMRIDTWGTPFEIECQGARVRVRSFGPDRVRETPDDLFGQ